MLKVQYSLFNNNKIEIDHHSFRNFLYVPDIYLTFLNLNFCTCFFLHFYKLTKL
jgi:hypothetical protein